jgi:hypothetical protein
MNKIALAILAALSASIALADDFKTIDGTEYKNVTVSGVEPDGIVLISKSGISKVYFTELPKDVQQRFGYDAVNHDAYAAEPITVELKNEILNALRMTDELDALYKGGCSSVEFIAAARPIESVFMNLQNKLPRGDPRRDLSANTFEAYQQLALAMKGNEQGKGERPDAIFAAAENRKGMLTKILQGNMTPEEKAVYDVWRKGATNP